MPDPDRSPVTVTGPVWRHRLVAIALAIFVLCASGHAQALRVGRALVDITPPVDMPFQVPQVAPYRVVGAQAIHDPLHAKAVVFEVGGVKAAIVTCDLTSIPISMIVAARTHVGKICGVPPENVMITATHTHTGPNIRPRFFQTASPHQVAIANAYLPRLPEMMAESVQQAEANLMPVKMQGALGKVHGVAFNRRFLMKDGRVYANPGKSNDAELLNVVRAAGPTDPGLPLVYFETPEGKPVASMINFSMHLDSTGGFAYSADYPFQVAKILSDVKGPEMLTHFTIGAAGNINHYALLDPKRPHRVKGYGEAARIGALLAAEVVRSYQRTQPLDAKLLKVSRENVRLKLLAEKSQKAVAEHKGKPFFDGEILETFVDGHYTFEAEVMVIALGDEVAFVGVPGELFVELGLMVKQNSPYRLTFLNAIANGSIGYIPNRKAQREGGYGAAPSSTCCDPGSGEALAESAIRQLVALRDMKSTAR